MLTKDLLKYKFKDGKFIPSKLDKSEPKFCGLANELIEIYANGLGKTFKGLDLKAQKIKFRQQYIIDGFKKLIIDRCEWEEPSEDTKNFRWEVFHHANEVWEIQNFQSLEEYREIVAGEYQMEANELSEHLYCDLKEFRKLTKAPSYSANELIDRYNCAQIQGLLMRALNLKIKVQDASVNNRRKLFQSLKFLQLIADDIEENKSQFSFELSGPMSIFDSGQTYGVKMAIFFLFLLRMDKFELKAEVEFKDREQKGMLEVNENTIDKLKNSEYSGYYPEELTIISKTLEEKYKGLSVGEGTDWINLGHQNYSFPDLTIKVDNKNYYIELFHKWHKHQLAKRLDLLSRQSYEGYKIGVDRTLSKSKEMKDVLEKSSWFKENGFVFNGFPTETGLKKILQL